MIQFTSHGADWSLQAAQHGAHGTGAGGFVGLWILLIIGLIGVLIGTTVSNRTGQTNRSKTESEETRPVRRRATDRGDIDDDS